MRFCFSRSGSRLPRGAPGRFGGRPLLLRFSSRGPVARDSLWFGLKLIPMWCSPGAGA